MAVYNFGCLSSSPPNDNVTRQDIINLINELQNPFILTGDLNSRSPIWGNSVHNTKGRIIEDIIINNNNCALLNDGTITYQNIDTGKKSAIDLTICSPRLLTSLSWTVNLYLHNSDHFPTHIRLIELNKSTKMRIQKWKENDGDWV